MKIKQWSSIKLHVGYDRHVVGVDLRDRLTASQLMTANSISSWIPATADQDIWLQKNSENWLLTDYGNGLSLVNPTVKGVLNFSEINDSQFVAFDFPMELCEKVSKTFGLITLPVNVLQHESKWKFIGYDIVDITTFSSGFYSFDWSKNEILYILSQLSLSFNIYGLLDEESDAIRSAIAFDALVKEHSPFAPCGVWIRVTGHP